MSVTLNGNTPLCIRSVKLITAYLTALVLILSITAGTAWSFDIREAEQNLPLVSDNFSQEQSSPRSTADSCLPLLKSIRHTTPPSAMDRNQRSAGKAAALGLVFGVRFALSPPEKATSSRSKRARLDVWQTSQATVGNRHALAVADYRACQKEQALKALSDFRWQR